MAVNPCSSSQNVPNDLSCTVGTHDNIERESSIDTGSTNSVHPSGLTVDRNISPDRSIAPRIHNQFNMIAPNDIKKEPGVLGGGDDDDDDASCNLKRNTGNDLEKQPRIKVESDYTAYQRGQLTNAPPKCFDRTVCIKFETDYSESQPEQFTSAPHSHNHINIEQTEAPLLSTGSSDCLPFPAPTRSQSFGSKHTVFISDSGDGVNPDPSIPRQTRSRSRTFFVDPILDSSDSESEERYPSSNPSNAQGEVKRITTQKSQAAVGSVSTKKPRYSYLTEEDVEWAPDEEDKRLETDRRKRKKQVKEKKKESNKTCKVCGKTFTRTNYLATHMKFHAGERPYKCQHCDCTYKIESHLKAHYQNKHASSTLYPCSKCGKELSYITSRDRHEKSCNKECSDASLKDKAYDKLFPCSKCDKQFAYSASRDKHEKTCGQEFSEASPRDKDETSCPKPFPCSKCGKLLAYKTSRNRHEKTCGKDLSERIEFRCEVCSKEFVTAKGFSKHHCDMSGQGELTEKELSFKCVTCDKSFATSEALEQHKSFICGKVPAFTCDQCGKVYTTKEQYDTHTRRFHTGERPFKCSVCDSRFYSAAVLKRHMKRHDENRMSHCTICEASFCDEKKLSVHYMRLHCGLTPYKCNECDADFSNAARLSKHIQMVHRMERQFKCSVCSEEFFDQKEYRSHTAQHRRPSKHTCTICNQAFFGQSLRSHVAYEHPGMTMSQALGRELLRCPVCGLEFTHKRTLRGHKMTHSTFKSHKCDKCDRQFSNKSSLRVHMTKHSQERNHRCKVCGETFRWATNLYQHKLKHHIVAPDIPIDVYVCNDCGRTFKKDNFLYLHLKSKTKEQGGPCICHQCGRGYTSAEEYKAHVSTHDKASAKPYLCSLCGAGFHFQQFLNRHKMLRHGGATGTTWLCEECGKHFSRKLYLLRHRARHAKYPEGKIPNVGGSRPKMGPKLPRIRTKKPRVLPKGSGSLASFSRKESGGLKPMQQDQITAEVEPQGFHMGGHFEGDSIGHKQPGAASSESQGATVSEDLPHSQTDYPQLSEGLTTATAQNYPSQYNTFVNQFVTWPKSVGH